MSVYEDIKTGLEQVITHETNNKFKEVYMNKDKIIKGLGCCNGAYSTCDECPYQEGTRCWSLEADALELIKELIKDYEELKKQFDALDYECCRLEKVEWKYHELKTECEKSNPIFEILMRNNEELEEELAQTYDLLDESKAKTIRKIQENITMHFGTYTDKDEVKVLDVVKLINKIGEEMLEE